MHIKGVGAVSNILLLEDDENVNRGISFSLKKSGYTVFEAETLSEAKKIAKEVIIDIAICDINLPDGNGLEFVRWLRKNQSTYIICLTALEREMEQVMGYEAGADDYITKPFSLSVLQLKIEAQIRRGRDCNETERRISKDIVLFPAEMKVLAGGQETALTKNEWKLLSLFFQYPKQVLSKNQILEQIFDLSGEYVDENTVAVNIRRLREKIEPNPAEPIYIKNIRGLGYVWNQEVRQG